MAMAAGLQHGARGLLRQAGI
ncbi:hypothetical protein CBM2609_B70139 [Cupriavidus taiwanensis]|nr:hypothetical protein CBM2604_B60137 [Cupriavidus taiwanensis]SOZ33195.1 hypothetical protein CBM2609_B70139 [Cupriavidus taiwanensis]SOZ48507.1 hypothetical protein CBM2610_B50136 [Cupriavidus taiwanensis]